MFSLQKLLGKDDRFFGLLDAAAEEARHSVEALGRGLAHPETALTMDEFIQARRAEKKIAAQISEALVETFVTTLEREDIELLADALYKIPKTVEKFAERYSISAGLIQGVDFSRQIKLLLGATDLVVRMVKGLHELGDGDLDRVKTMNTKLQEIEGQADTLILDVLEDLWSGRHHTTKVIVLKDLYELLEKIIDRCRDAGKVVTHIVLKNS
jgi:uncharacterized protein Yka (UPF0111/DUF47 family)